MDDRRILDDAVVTLANRFQFDRSERRVDVVGSRMLLWCIRGYGTVRSAGSTFKLAPGAAIMLPWHHDVRYCPEKADPFLVGSIHIIPWHDPTVPVEPRVGHGSTASLTHAPFRQDRVWPGLNQPRSLPPAHSRRLIDLGEAIIDQWIFMDFRPEEPFMRAAGVVLARAIAAACAHAAAPPSPRALAALQETVRTRLAEPWTLSDLARAANCSRSTVERQFAKYTGQTAVSWVREQRLSRAALLLRTTTQSASSIARTVGYTDPLYFSRAFRKQYGTSPREYRIV